MPEFRNQVDRDQDLPSARAGYPVGSAWLNVRSFQLLGVEDLREAVYGSDLNIVQLAPGSFTGHLMHARIGSLALSSGDFGPDIRARGVMNPHLVTIGMMLESSGDVSQWNYDVVPGDVVVFPKSVEQEGHFTGHSRYATITLGEDEIAAHMAGERALEDPEFWTKIYRFRPTPSLRQATRAAIATRVHQLCEGTVPRSQAGIDFIRRSLIEAFLAGVICEISQQGEKRDRNGARLVRDVEDYVDALGMVRPVHISELCSALMVSRRTLHRTFCETLGTGPMAYLRLRRLSAVHRALRLSKSSHASVTQAALEHGFSDLGRFAVYYRNIFGESPSQTRRQAAAEDIRSHEHDPDAASARRWSNSGVSASALL